MESARTMLQARDLPVKLWAEAINTAVYILNRTAIKKKKSVTPFEAWNKKKPELSHVKVFGTKAYAYIDKQFRNKMDKKANKLILVGYQSESTNYRLWDPETNKITISRNVVFDENIQSKSSDRSDAINVEAWPQQDGEEEDASAPDDNQVEEFKSASEHDSNEEVQEREEPRQLNKVMQSVASRSLRNRASINLQKGTK